MSAENHLDINRFESTIASLDPKKRRAYLDNLYSSLLKGESYLRPEDIDNAARLFERYGFGSHAKHIEGLRPKAGKYYVVLEYTGSGMGGVRTWSGFDSREDFVKWYDGKMQIAERVVAAGVSAEEAARIADEVPQEVEERGRRAFARDVGGIFTDHLHDEFSRLAASENPLEAAIGEAGKEKVRRLRE